MLRRVIPLVAVLLLSAWSSDAMRERDVGATDFNAMLVNCKDRNLAEFWREISTKTSAAIQSSGPLHYELQFYRKGEETNLSNESEDKHYHLRFSTSNNTIQKFSRVIAMMVPDSNCTFQGHFALNSNRLSNLQLTHCFHQNDTIVIHEGQMATLDFDVYIGLTSSTQASSCISIGVATLDEFQQFHYTQQDIVLPYTDETSVLDHTVTMKRLKRAAPERATTTNAYLIFANRLYIHQLSLDGSRLKTLVSRNLVNTIAVDYHYREQQIYWTDVSANRIMRSYFNGSHVKTVINLNVGAIPDGVAVDWISNKLYWTDTNFDTIEVLDLDKSIHKILVNVSTGSSVTFEPRAIVLDPHTRWMYWTDWGSNARIEKASMDGKNRTVIHNTSLTWPNALTLDYQRQVLYWADASLDKIESSNVDGSNRQLLATVGVGHPYGLALLHDTLYFTDWNGNSVKVVHVNGSNATTIFDGQSVLCTQPFGIAVVSEAKQPLVFNPCSANNGGCSHFCLLSAVDSRSYSCDCPSGMMLINELTCSDASTTGPTQQPLEIQRFGTCHAAGYGSSCCVNDSCQGSPSNCYCDSNCHLFQDCCTDVSPTCATQDFDGYLIIANTRFIHRLSLWNESVPRLQTIHSGLIFNTGINFLYRQNYLFWTDYLDNKIWRSNLDGGQVVLITDTDQSGPVHLAVDWVTLKLYWTGYGAGFIEVYDLVTSYHKHLITLEPGAQPFGIVVDPTTRYVYWTDNANSRIERASMDGAARETIINTMFSYPLGIALDHLTQTLYWTDNNGFIESSDTTGSNRRVLAINIIANGIDFFRGKLYFTSNGISSASVNQPNSTMTDFNVVTCSTLFDIKVISEERQIPAMNPCGNNNGGCSHLCLLSSTDPRGYSCACHNGTVLHQDQLQCIGDASTEAPDQQGSCFAAGHRSCCTSGRCHGEPSNCYCDNLCTVFGDCCPDAIIICGSMNTSIRQLIFVTEPLSQTAVEGQIVIQFDCSVQSDIQLTFVWEFTRSGSDVSQVIADLTGPVVPRKYSVINIGHASSRLEVHGIAISDAGSYTCRVTSSSGQTIQADAILEISFPPRDIEISGSTTVTELETMVIFCQFLANPKPSARWLKRETDSLRVLTNTSRISVSTFQEDTYSHRSMMVIERARATDSGEYLCEVENGVLSTLPTVSSIMVTVNAMNECRTDNGNSPCKNGGVCTDLVNAYLCTCSGGFQGTNCDTPLTETDAAPPDIKQPPENVTTDLVSSVNLTCTAEGHPAPTYEWYKDGVLIPGEHLPFLYIPEVLPADRGSYTCKAINSGGEIGSLSASLEVPGLYQYSTLLQLSTVLNNTDEVLLMIAISNLSLSSAFVHSVEVLSQSRSDEVEILITVIRRNETSDHIPIQVVEGLRQNLYSQLLAIQNAQVIELSRYDGCNPETFEGSEWPETNLGSSASVPCPCSEFAGSLAGKIFRLCEGTYSQRARWSDHVDDSQCTALSSQQTRLLCEAAQNASSARVAVSALVAQVTSEPENLDAADVSVSISIVNQLTDEAVTNLEVRDNFLEIIDNIQQADRDTVFTSQNATNSSSRLLDSLSDFLDKVILNDNLTNSKTVFGYETYALQIQQLDPLEFNGQTLIVDLGSVAEAMNSTQIQENELITSETVMSVVTNATASVSIPRDLVNGLENCQAEVSNSSQLRLSYSVFLSDILFQTFNQSQFKVGSIIVSARLNCLGNDVLTSPIQTSFRTDSQISGVSDTICAHWDSNRFGAWSNDGCMKIDSNGDSISCECRQLAHFGILFDLSPSSASGDTVLVLSVFSYIGLVTSLLCLCIFLFTYLWVKKLRLSIHGQILVNLCLALMGLYVFFLISGHVTSVPVLCGISSALLQYFLLVFFGWTAVEAVWLYLNLVKVFGIQSYTAKYTLKASIPTWVVPMLIVILSAGPGYKYYTNSFYCRATEWPFWFGTIVPFLVTYIFNWIMFITIMVSICKHTRSISRSKDDKNQHTLQSTKKNFTIALTLAIVFGLGWAFGLTATSLPVEELTLTFQIIFCILVGAQGVLIFLFHGVRNKDFRSFWMQILRFIGRKTRLTYVLTSTKSSAVPTSMHRGTDSTALTTLPRKKEIVSYENVRLENAHDNTLKFSSAEEKDINVITNEAYGTLQGHTGSIEPANYEEVHIYDRPM